MQRAAKQAELKLANIAAQRVLTSVPERSLVLDIGGGGGQHSRLFAENNLFVVYNDFVKPKDLSHPSINFAIGNFMSEEFVVDFDVVFASHVLEHQPNVNAFLKKVTSVAAPDALIAITVPPAKGQIVSGHLTVWNAGLLLYNMVMAGLNCRQASVLQYDYNISVLVRKDEINLPELNYDYGDLTKLREYLPTGLVWEGDSFNGDIQELNWDGW